MHAGIQVLLHIDSQETTWRNVVNFDPLKQYGGFSYEDVVVRPAVDAVRTTTKPSTKVWFMMSGEMGRSLWGHPRSWQALLSKYRGVLAVGKVPSNIKVGIALHWNKVCGDCFPMPRFSGPDAYTRYNNSYIQQYRAAKPQFDVYTIKRVLMNCDVIGISHYAPMPLGTISAANFDTPINTAAFELNVWEIDLHGIIANGNKDFIFSEVGLGGGDQDSKLPAADLQSLAGHPSLGIWGKYNVGQDPWKRYDYAHYRRRWFFGLITWLRGGGSPKWKINGAFIWSVGSWDVAGVHPISTSEQGSYEDMHIIKEMKTLSSNVS